MAEETRLKVTLVWVCLSSSVFCFSEERKPSIQEIASQKGIIQRANGWRVQHIAGQMDELVRKKLERISYINLSTGFLVP